MVRMDEYWRGGSRLSLWLRNVVRILADTAEDVNSLDELKITEAKKAAEHRIANAKNDAEFVEASAMLEKQLTKLSILTKRKKKYQR